MTNILSSTRLWSTCHMSHANVSNVLLTLLIENIHSKVDHHKQNMKCIYYNGIFNLYIGVCVCFEFEMSVCVAV